LQPPGAVVFVKIDLLIFLATLCQKWTAITFSNNFRNYGPVSIFVTESL